MTILNRITLAALLLSTATIFAEAPNNDTNTIASNTVTTIASTNFTNLNLPTNPSKKPFFLLPELMSDDRRNQAFAMLEVAFGKWNKKDEVILCTYNHFQNKAITTKYKDIDGVLSPIKSEEYTGPADGSPSITKNVRKGRDARSTIPAQEGAARLFRAATKPENITQVSFIELYNNCIPLCMQVDSSVQATQFISYAQAQLAQAAIDPSVRAPELKPLCVLIVNGDHLLKTIGDSQWAALQNMFNITTLYDIEVRKYILEMRKALCDMVKDAKDGIDLNPSFMEGLFEDINSTNSQFNYKKITRDVVKKILSIEGFVTLAGSYGLYKLLTCDAAQKMYQYPCAKWQGQSVEDYRAQKEAQETLKKEEFKAKVDAAKTKLKQ
jgi:hypothetical protein